jgi:hypothetical protein
MRSELYFGVWRGNVGSGVGYYLTRHKPFTRLANTTLLTLGFNWCVYVMTWLSLICNISIRRLRVMLMLMMNKDNVRRCFSVLFRRK